MRKKATLFLLLSVCIFFQLNAQKITPKNMLEVGVTSGVTYVSGDVSAKPGFAAGLHFRKATDYVFSVRGDLLYGQSSEGKSSEADRKLDNLSWMSGTLYGVLSFNNFKFDKGSRKFNYYAMMGAGGNYFETEYTERKPDKIEREFAPHAGAGAGIAVRLSKRANLGIEHQAMFVFGRRADLIDGIEQEGTSKTPFRDILNYTCLKLSFNLGNPANKSEPLYWVNPLESVLDDVSDIKKKQDLAITDSDNDGVIDAIDQEPNTPADAPVDTKGRVLDSDKDGVPDFQDKEPYYPPKAGERVDSEGVVTNPTQRQGVTEDRVQEMIDEALNNYTAPSGGGGSVADWFLPMLHFGTDSYSIKYSDYGNLASIARMMKSNSQLRLVVTGHTDQSGSETYNDYLSYQRAKAVIDHLVSNHGIGRGRLVLQWQGKQDALVPKNRSYMNRRAELRVATASDYEMDPPSNTGGSKSGY